MIRIISNIEDIWMEMLTCGSYAIPPEDFGHNSIDVRHMRTIGKDRKPVVTNHGVDLFLCFPLDS